VNQVGDVMVAERRVSGEALRLDAARVVSGLTNLGVAPGDAVALLLRNDAALLAATLAASHLGAYPVHINWHANGNEVAYVLADSQARVLIAHADLLHELDEMAPPGLVILGVPTPEAIARAYRIPDARRAVPPGVLEWTTWLSAYGPSTRLHSPRGLPPSQAGVARGDSG
jgi:long-chain acyl-CoA synthetase